MNKLLRYLIQGLAVVAPIGITLFVLIKIFLLLDNILPKDVELWTGFKIGDIPGLGILFLVAILLLAGFLANSFIAKPIQGYFSKLLNKAPLVKTVYDSVKDLVGAFVGNKKKFDKPVLVKEQPDSAFKRIGFITQNDLKELGMGEGVVSVYFPHSYAFSGMLFVVSKDVVEPIDAPAGEVMKFIVSGGVIKNED